MNNATYLKNVSTGVDSSENVQIKTFGVIVSFCTEDRRSNIELNVPKIFEMDITGREFSRQPQPYSKYFTDKLAGFIFGRYWEKYSFGVVPGSYFYDRGTLCFNGEKQPSMQTTGILMYANGSMVACARQYGLTSFNIGSTGMFGIILPMDYLKKVFRTSSSTGLFDIMKATQKSS